MQLGNDIAAQAVGVVGVVHIGLHNMSIVPKEAVPRANPDEALLVLGNGLHAFTGEALVAGKPVKGQGRRAGVLGEAGTGKAGKDKQQQTQRNKKNGRLTWHTAVAHCGPPLFRFVSTLLWGTSVIGVRQRVIPVYRVHDSTIAGRWIMFCYALREAITETFDGDRVSMLW